MNETKLLRAAYAYLERYNSSVENLRRVLLRKARRWQRMGASTGSADLAGPGDAQNASTDSDIRAAVDTVVERCVALELVDDERFVQVKAAGMRRRGGSGRRIRAMLSAKGVKEEVIETTLQSEEDSEEEAARIFARRRRLGPWRTDDRRQERRDRDIAAMCRAGFPAPLAISTIDGPGSDPDAV